LFGVYAGTSSAGVGRWPTSSQRTQEPPDASAAEIARCARCVPIC
jgi:hypothetical protein